MPDKGFFISLEGIDGSGKTTMAERLSRDFADAGYTVINIRHPGGTYVGGQLRELMDGSSMRRETMLFLMLADMAQSVRETIRPVLDIGCVVIADRYIGSTYAYQHGGYGIPKADLNDMVHFAVGDTIPDLTLFLDTSPLMAAYNRWQQRLRLQGRGGLGIFEKEKQDFFERVYQQYRELAEFNVGAKHWETVRTDGPLAMVHDRVVVAVNRRLASLDFPSPI